MEASGSIEVMSENVIRRAKQHRFAEPSSGASRDLLAEGEGTIKLRT
jgi:hypothetical protein